MVCVCERAALRYLYSFVWRNSVGALNDDLCASFLLRANSLLALLFALVLLMGGNYYGFQYSFCTGRDPKEDSNVYTAFPRKGERFVAA